MTEFFQNKLVETIHFMDVLNLKDSVEKDAFFRKLINLTEQLPREIVLAKVCNSFFCTFLKNIRELQTPFLSTGAHR